MSETTLYENRWRAGESLATEIVTALEGVTLSVRVCALPRGGIPVAAPIAQRLNCPLDVLAAKKISLPSNPELALGAVTPDGTTVWAQSPYLKRKNQQELDEARENALQGAIELQEQFNPYCASMEHLENTIIIVVDDGIATGMTMITAVTSLREKQPTEIWVAAPVAPPETKVEFLERCDRVLILQTPDPFMNVGRFYKHFPQVSTVEAISYLN